MNSSLASDPIISELADATQRALCVHVWRNGGGEGAQRSARNTDDVIGLISLVDKAA